MGLESRYHVVLVFEHVAVPHISLQRCGICPVTGVIAECFRNLSVDDSGPLGIELESTMANRNTALIKGS